MPLEFNIFSPFIFIKNSKINRLKLKYQKKLNHTSAAHTSSRNYYSNNNIFFIREYKKSTCLSNQLYIYIRERHGIEANHKLV